MRLPSIHVCFLFFLLCFGSGSLPESSSALCSMMDTLIPHKGEKSRPVCMPYALSNEVKVQPSLACINSLCQEVAFDPNTQTLAQNMADTSVSMWMRDVHCWLVVTYVPLSNPN